MNIERSTSCEQQSFYDSFAEGWLDVGAGHFLAWTEAGSKTGLPVVLLHGGPGAGVDPGQRSIFSPAFFRVIAFDQRGSGSSRPLGSLQRNCPQTLVEDIERVRLFCGIGRWIVVGGSWGATLATLYARAHPEACLALILRSFSRFDTSELAWFWSGPPRFNPAGWTDLMALVGASNEREVPCRLASVLDTSENLATAAANAFYDCFVPVGAIDGTKPSIDWNNSDTAAKQIAMVRIFLHFARNFALPDGWWRSPPTATRKIPAVLVHGARDIITPPNNALALAEDWPELDVRLIEGAGHSSREQSLRTALYSAVEKIVQKIEI